MWIPLCGEIWGKMYKNKILSITFILSSLIMLLNFSCSDDYTCSKNSDCYDGKVCNYHTCVDPPRLRICGEVVLDCNCQNTAKFPGQVGSTSLCESGKQQFWQCAGFCGYGYPWGSVCYCE